MHPKTRARRGALAALIDIEKNESILNTALDNDRAIQLSGKLGRATVAAPNTGATPAPGSTASPTPTATSGSADVPVALPADVTGQTAAQQTCTEGYRP